MNKLMRSICIGLIALVVAGGVTPSPALADGWLDRDYTAVYVFGDSLSDPGNKYAVYGQTNEPIWEAIPDDPYRGGHFSNGDTWAEVLAKGLRHYRGAMPAYERPWYGNYAFAGARARGSNLDKPTFGDQLGLYLSRAGGADPEALYVIQFGGNDIRDALEAAQAQPDPVQAFLAAQAILLEAGNALATHVFELRMAGANNFLIATAPNLGKAPVIGVVGAAAAAEQMSALFNSGLDAIIVQLAMSGANVHRVDLFEFVTTATAAPGAFGFADAEHPCLGVFTPPFDDVCTDANLRLFWDGIHPTAAGHRILGTIALNAVSTD